MHLITENTSDATRFLRHISYACTITPMAMAHAHTSNGSFGSVGKYYLIHVEMDILSGWGRTGYVSCVHDVHCTRTCSVQCRLKNMLVDLLTDYSRRLLMMGTNRWTKGIGRYVTTCSTQIT